MLIIKMKNVSDAAKWNIEGAAAMKTNLIATVQWKL